MGFGRGILADPQRTPTPEGLPQGTTEVLKLAHLPPFGRVMSNVRAESRATVLTPAPGNFPAPRSSSAPFQFIQQDGRTGEFGSHHEMDPFGLFPLYNDNVPETRDLISDARDLLIETLHRKIHGSTMPRTVAPPTWTFLESKVEDPAMWATPAINATEDGTPARFIHIGRTSRAEELLASLFGDSVVQTTFRTVYPSRVWRGLQFLDGDGYVLATVTTADNQRHLILAGGSDYGTYYAVAWFLWRFAEVRWLFPGDLGTHIPPAERFELNEAFFHLDEPHYRGRTLGHLVHQGFPSVHTAREINDARNWALRNRLHPHEERITLFWQRPIPVSLRDDRTLDENPANRFCRSLPLSKRKFLAQESRIPVGHGLSRFFSPHTPSFDPAAVTAGAPLRSNNPDPYPDSRPQVPSSSIPELTQLGAYPATAGQRGPGRNTYLFGRSDPGCNFPPGSSLRDDPCYCPDATLDSLIEMTGPGAPSNVRGPNGYQDRFSSATAGTLLSWRFLPRVRPRTHAGDQIPFEGWTPCLFEQPAKSEASGDENLRATFRETVAVDLANQLILSSVIDRVIQRNLDAEFCEKLGTDDGPGFWCGCVPCRSTLGIDGTAVLFKGKVIVPNHARFLGEVDSLWLLQDATNLPTLRERARQVLSPCFATLSAERLARMEDLTAADFIDQMVLRGVIPDRARLSVPTRRITVLLTRVAILLSATPSQSSTFQLTNFTRPRDVLLTFLTYQDYTAPPIFEADPIRQPGRFYPLSEADYNANARDLQKTVLHPSLTPMISGSRDLLEYDPHRLGTNRPFDYSGMTFFDQFHRAPERFNLLRWSKIARQTGLYEWMYGANSLVPRIYTKRLRNALKDSYESARARVFYAETLPHMGLDGIRFYEAARLLWNVNEDPDAIRTEFCQALFGTTGPVFTAMRDCFNSLERIWCSRDPANRNPPGTVPANQVPPEQRTVSGFNLGTFSGYGQVGRLGWTSELDAFMRRPEDVTMHRVPAERDMPFFAASGPWEAVQTAYRESPVNSPQRERVQYFRRALGLVATMIRVYQPVLAMWVLVERFYNPLFNDPLTWVQFSPDDMPRPAGEIGVLAENVLPIDFRITFGNALSAVPWTAPSSFRTVMRDPIHNYITNRTEVDGLGLGLGSSSYTPGGMNEIPVDSTQTTSTAVRFAYNLLAIQQYVTWWNDYGRRSPRDPAHQGDDGMGGSLFVSMKNMIAAMMILSLRRRVDGGIEPRFLASDIVQVRDTPNTSFMVNA